MALREINVKQRITLLIVLGWMSMYMGTVSWDSSVNDGKNLVNFLFLYLIGNSIHKSKEKWVTWNLKYLLLAYLILNVLLFYGGICLTESNLEKIYWKVCFPYCSPLLIINAILFLLIFAKLKFQSVKVNNLASSCLSIYLIHGAFLLYGYNYGKVVIMHVQALSNSFLIQMAIVMFLSFIVCMTCIIIDKILTPVWGLFLRLANCIQKGKFGIYIDEYVKLGLTK